jgi:hypothetical protein
MRAISTGAKASQSGAAEPLAAAGATLCNASCSYGNYTPFPLHFRFRKLSWINKSSGRVQGVTNQQTLVMLNRNRQG